MKAPGRRQFLFGAGAALAAGLLGGGGCALPRKSRQLRSEPWRLLPAGDSNTAWVGYRQHLRHLLVAAGYPVDFVGSLRTGAFDDNQHEGYRGEGLNRLLKRVEEGMLEQHRPDVVYLMVGANDLWVSLQQRVPIGDGAAQDNVDRFAQLLTQMAQRSPDTHLIVAKPTTPGNAVRPLQIYRAGLEATVRQKQRAGVRVSCIDTEGLPNDGVHFTDRGFRELAERWFAATRAVLPV